MVTVNLPRRSGARPVVTVLSRTLPHYRVRFQELLRGQLEERGLEYRFVYGAPNAADALKSDTRGIAHGIAIPNHTLRAFGTELCWQPALRHIRGSDLVVVAQASRLLVNYLLFLEQQLGTRKLALWGHGRNFQVAAQHSRSEWLKRQLSRRVHWWFAYNDLSAAAVRALGFPAERITAVGNTIDMRQLADDRQAVAAEEVARIRERLGIVGTNVAAFVGGMYTEKRIPFLLEAAQEIRRQIPNFHLLMIGGGVDSRLVQAAAATNPWLHHLGPLFGREKAAHLAVARLLLMPGLVGLAVLDSFALELPMVTTDIPYHSPEIDYLEDRVNGAVVLECDSVQAYANRVVCLLRDGDERERLISGCRAAAARYSVESMAERFADGVVAALGQPHLLGSGS